MSSDRAGPGSELMIEAAGWARGLESRGCEVDFK